MLKSSAVDAQIVCVSRGLALQERAERDVGRVDHLREASTLSSRGAF
jgi:hypothetical protein